MSDADLLRAAIERSGLTVRAFSRDVLVRDARTVFRWLASAGPLPREVRIRCLEIVNQPARTGQPD